VLESDDNRIVLYERGDEEVRGLCGEIDRSMSNVFLAGMSTCISFGLLWDGGVALLPLFGVCVVVSTISVGRLSLLYATPRKITLTRSGKETKLSIENFGPSFVVSPSCKITADAQSTMSLSATQNGKNEGRLHDKTL
jgi:hypothetical protein